MGVSVLARTGGVLSAIEMLQQLPITPRRAQAYNAAGSGRVMDYIKGVLSGLAAIFVAEFVFFWPTLSREKATGLAVLKFLLVESVLSPRF